MSLQRRETDTYHILILIIGFGKIVHGDHAIYARGMRHRDVTLYLIGTLVVWLLHH